MSGIESCSKFADLPAELCSLPQELLVSSLNGLLSLPLSVTFLRNRDKLVIISYIKTKSLNVLLIKAILMWLTIIFYIGWRNEGVVSCWNATIVNNPMVIWDKCLQNVRIAMWSLRIRGAAYQERRLALAEKCQRSSPQLGNPIQRIQENVQWAQQLQPRAWKSEWQLKRILFFKSSRE